MLDGACVVDVSGGLYSRGVSALVGAGRSSGRGLDRRLLAPDPQENRRFSIGPPRKATQVTADHECWGAAGKRVEVPGMLSKLGQPLLFDEVMADLEPDLTHLVRVRVDEGCSLR